MIYFVLPIYNEEKNLRQVITKLRQLKKPSPYKIMAINDGSLDQSLQILQEMKGNDLFIDGSIINMNVGAVFSCGIDRVLSEAQDNDIMVIMESDQTSEIDFVQALILEIEKSNSDVVIASRYKKGGRYENFPLPRRLFSSWANYLMKVYFPIPHVEDYTIFFRAYRVRLLKRMVAYFGKFGLLQSKGFVANAELLVKASLFTNKFSEIPYVYDYKKKLGKSKINILRTINEYFVFIAYMKRIIKKSQALKSLQHTQGLLV